MSGGDDRLTAEDWALYGGGYSLGTPSFYNDKGKEEEDDEVFKKPSFYSSDFVSRKKRVQQHDPDDPIVREIERQPEDVEQLLKLAGGSTGFNTPIQESEFNKRVIPYDIQHSADTLLRAAQGGEIRLGREAFQTIKRLADCADEFTQVDPRVVLYDTFTTGVCEIYVKEVVPISILLLARYFNLDYSVQITKDLESVARPFREVKVKPFRGTLTTHVQGLGCQDAVKRAMQNNVAKWSLVKMYMMRVGAQSPTSIAGDYEWIEAQTRAIGSVINKQPKFQEEEGL